MALSSSLSDAEAIVDLAMALTSSFTDTNEMLSKAAPQITRMAKVQTCLIYTVGNGELSLRAAL